MTTISNNPVQASGSALREFYAANTNDGRIEAYSRFARSCQEYANVSGFSFLEASQRIHNIFNINTGNK